MLKKLFGNKKTVADIVLVAALLVISLSVFIIVEATRAEGVLVRVSVGDAVSEEYPLNIDGEYALNGGSNILVVDGGAAYIREADCPRQICVRSGRISRSGQRITCLENRVVVEIVGGEEILEVK